MPSNPGFGQRAREARRLWTLARDRELTYAEIGQLVAQELQRGEPFTHQAVRKWFAEGREPDSFATTEALARVLNVPVEWLAFGKGSPDGRSFRLEGERDADEVLQERAAAHRRAARKKA